MIDLGNNDDPVAVTQMLKFFYDGTYHLTEPLNDLCLKHLKDSCLKYLAMYRLADFYDARALREDASSRLILCLNHMPCGVKGDDHVRIIQKILGPDTKPFADNDIKRIVWNHIFDNTSVLYHNELFQIFLADGVMFEERIACVFVHATGEVMMDLKKKSEYVSSQCDSTHRIMFLRLTDITVLL